MHILNDCYDAFGMPLPVLKKHVQPIETFVIKKSFTYTKRPYEVYCSADIAPDLINFIELTMKAKDVMAFESRVELGLVRINKPLSEEESASLQRFYLTLVG